MPKFPKDAPKAHVVSALEALGFQIVREREHIAMVRENTDGTKTPLTLPNTRRSSLRLFESFAVRVRSREKTFSRLTSSLERRCLLFTRNGGQVAGPGHGAWHGCPEEKYRGQSPIRQVTREDAEGGRWAAAR
jgi:hypothetical protein